MTTKRKATIEDLYRVRENRRAELVNGTIVLLPLATGAQSQVEVALLGSLSDFGRATGLGHAVTGAVAFIVDLPHRKSVSPNIAFWTGKLTMAFPVGAPIFAVEVRSAGDYGPAAAAEMTAKRADYFAAGTQVVWDVDLLSADVVRVYRAGQPDQPALYRRGEIAEAEPALPGWTMPVDDLFPRPRATEGN